MLPITLSSIRPGWVIHDHWNQPRYFWFNFIRHSVSPCVSMSWTRTDLVYLTRSERARASLIVLLLLSGPWERRCVRVKQPFNMLIVTFKCIHFSVAAIVANIAGHSELKERKSLMHFFFHINALNNKNNLVGINIGWVNITQPKMCRFGSTCNAPQLLWGQQRSPPDLYQCPQGWIPSSLLSLAFSLRKKKKGTSFTKRFKRLNLPTRNLSSVTSSVPITWAACEAVLLKIELQWASRSGPGHRGGDFWCLREQQGHGEDMSRRCLRGQQGHGEDMSRGCLREQQGHGEDMSRGCLREQQGHGEDMSRRCLRGNSKAMERTWAEGVWGNSKAMERTWAEGVWGKMLTEGEWPCVWSSPWGICSGVCWRRGSPRLGCLCFPRSCTETEAQLPLSTGTLDAGEGRDHAAVRKGRSASSPENKNTNKGAQDFR